MAAKGQRRETEKKFQRLAEKYEAHMEKETAKYQRLIDLDLFVLDNSIRESTVGQLRGHTLESKFQLYEEVKKCGFKHTIVASFSHMTRVDDLFIKQLVERGEDRDGLWAFSEITEGAVGGVPNTETVPIGLRKLEEVGLYNVIFELDLGDSTYNFDKFSIEKICMLLQKWIQWTHDHLHKNAKVFVSFRDLPDAMPEDSTRVFQVVDFLCKLPASIALFGLMFEEPTGKSLPEECATWAKFIKEIMDNNKWNGHLLVHVHQKFGYCDATALEVLMNGANGIWASVCIEGSSMGNASSCVTLLNLIRLGNRKVIKKFNCAYLRQAAIEVTKLTTGVDPHIKQPIYGARALDFVFNMQKEEFDLATFFGEKPLIRITTLSSPAMIRQRMANVFGESEDFTEEIAFKMKEKMLEDLKANRKEEYMSKVGLAVLFDRAGGKLTAEMSESIADDPIKKPHAANIIAEIRKTWDTWDVSDKKQGDNMLQFDSFYNGFMAPYFGCYRCSETKKALKALDMDCDGFIDWCEFLVYIKWALKQYPDTKTCEGILEIAFRKGLMPAMRDEMQKQS